MASQAISANPAEVLQLTKEWLADVSGENIYTKRVKETPFPRSWLVTPCLSPMITLQEPTDHDLVLVQQFFIHQDQSRQNEIRNCLRFNAHNNSIKKIVLLNEREYTENELGVSSDKIEQVIISERLTFKKAFEYAETQLKDKTIVLANSDIFFDGSVTNCNRLELHNNKRILCQSRVEYRLEKNLTDCIGIERHDSQDVWIWNTTAVRLDDKQLSMLDFGLGKPGCDNRILFVMDMIGVTPHNLPLAVKCYHYHNIAIRNYGAKDLIKPEYLGLFPRIEDYDIYNTKNTSFMKSVDSKRFDSYISGASNPFSVSRSLNKDAIILLQTISTLQKTRSQQEAITFAQSNGINVSSFQELSSWMHLTRKGITDSDAVMVKHPLSKPIQQEDIALSSYHSSFKDRYLFEDSILYWYIANRANWFADKDLVIVSPYNEAYKEKEIGIKCKSKAFVDVDVNLSAMNMIGDLVSRTLEECKKLESPMVILATELYDSALSGEIKEAGQSSVVVGEYIFGYFSCISNHPQEPWHKTIMNICS
tara:strand:- start:600 stop:2204 length:1605 start_codon:yes stop_codon:yes gene_type:complete